MPKPNLNIVLLPGLDGTGRLFEFLLPFLPSYLNPIIVSYPTAPCLDYNALQDFVIKTIPTTGYFVLLAESFSGPIALNIAASGQRNLVAVILVATFIQNPLPKLISWSRYFIAHPLFRYLVPSALIRSFLLGRNSPKNLTETFFEILRSLCSEILAYRIRLVLTVDVRQALLACSVPILYLFPTKDKVVTKRSRDIILRLRSEIEFVAIDAPHMLLQCEPLIASKAIDNFLQRLSMFVTYVTTPK